MIVTLDCKQTGGFSAALLNTRDLANNKEKQIRTSMAAMGYHMEGMKQHTIGGKEARGFRCSSPRPRKVILVLKKISLTISYLICYINSCPVAAMAA